MPKLDPLWRTDPIQYLLQSKFPLYSAFTSLATFRRSGETPEKRQQMLEEAKAFKQHLESLPEEEIQTLITEAHREERQRQAEKNEREEKMRAYNQPDAAADYDYWAKASFWSPNEATALSPGRDPRTVTWESVNSQVQISPFAKSFADRRDLIMRAVGLGQLYNRTSPSIFLAWAQRMKISVPIDLITSVEDLGIQIADWKSLFDQKADLARRLEKSLESEKEFNKEISKRIGEIKPATDNMRHRLIEGEKRINELECQLETAANTNQSAASRERQTLLKLVLGMAIKGYAHNPDAARTSTAAEISGDLEQLGISVSDDTIRKYLTEAKEHLP
jgi:hypothetical protein